MKRLLPLHPSLLACPLHRQPLEVPGGGQQNHKHQSWLMCAHWQHTHIVSMPYAEVHSGNLPNHSVIQVYLHSNFTLGKCLIWSIVAGLSTNWVITGARRQPQVCPTCLSDLECLCPWTHMKCTKTHRNTTEVLFFSGVGRRFYSRSFWSLVIQIPLSSTRLGSECYWLQQQWPPFCIRVLLSWLANFLPVLKSQEDISTGTISTRVVQSHGGTESLLAVEVFQQSPRLIHQQHSRLQKFILF